MTTKLETLTSAVQQCVGDRLQSLKTEHGELTIEVRAADYYAVMQLLRDSDATHF